MFYWYLIHTKPRQERIALENLARQGYECYLPMFQRERLRQRKRTLLNEPLFPRYLFIHLDSEHHSKSWSPIRSTLGVARMVSFGTEPARVPETIIAGLKTAAAKIREQPTPLFEPGERVCLTDGAFAGIEGVYQMADGQERVMVLIELLQKPVAISVAVDEVKKLTN